MSFEKQRHRKLLLIEGLLEDLRITLSVAAPSFLGLQNSKLVSW